MSPSSGAIPAKGILELTISVCPKTSGAFDINICINIRDGSNLNVRVTGSAEIPDINVEKVVCYIL